MVERLILWHRAVSRTRGSSDPAVVAAWSKAVAGRFSAAGGSVLAQLSATVVASFETGDLGDVVDVALDLLDEADDGPLAVSFGAAVSAIDAHAGFPSGAAFEASEALAVRAHAGELVLDPVARDRARGLFLFARHIGGGAAASKAASVDRTHPRRDSCAPAMARLGAVPLAPATAALLPVLVNALRDPETVAVLRGPVGAGTVELLRAAEAQLAPRHVIEIGGATAGLAPLGSLRAAIGREAGLRALIATAPEAARAMLASVADGALPSREALLSALAATIDAAVGPVWIFLTPLGFVDAATLVLVAALHRARPNVALVVRHAVDAPLPALLGDPPRVELTLPSLRTGDARVIAEALLGEATPEDVSRRVAVLGGDTPLGVLEAARAMIGAGDLVLEGERFVWRSTPRGGVRALALDVLVAERLELLDDESRRVLEAVAVVPDGSARALVEAVAASDGVRPRAIARGMERLAREGWLDARDAERTPRPITSFARRFVMSALPPARAAELHRFVAAALDLSGADSAAGATERALQLVLGGRDDEAAPLLLASALAMRDAGYDGSAAQLAVYVLRSAATGEARTGAQALARELASHRADGEDLARRILGTDPVTLRHHALAKVEAENARLEPLEAAAPLAVDAHGDPGTEERFLEPEPEEETDLLGDVRAAIHRRDFAALDHLAERAIAEGNDMAAVARLRALGEALRGDLAGAQRRLDRARTPSTAGDRKTLLADAMVALRAGQAPTSLRLSLSALADARRASDARGETAALFTIAACYRALGRGEDAALLEPRA